MPLAEVQASTSPQQMIGHSSNHVPKGFETRPRMTTNLAPLARKMAVRWRKHGQSLREPGPWLSFQKPGVAGDDFPLLNRKQISRRAENHLSVVFDIAIKSGAINPRPPHSETFG